VTRLRIMVAGAGIGGLAVALGLLRAGHEVRVFERTARLGEVGAGLTVTPNAAHVLHALGVWPALRAHVVMPATGAVRNGVSNELLGVRQLGESMTRQFGAEYFQVHRADLHGALLAAVLAIDADAISLDDAFVALERNDGSGVRVRFARSGEQAGDLLLGADGLRSQVRNALFGEQATCFAGYVAYRGLVPAERLPDSMLEHASCLYVGPRNMFLRYLVSAGRLVNAACIASSDAWTEEGWSVPADTDELLGLLDGWHADVRAIASAIPPQSLFKWGLFERSALPGWSVERATLLGDAAHPMLPFLGQGVVMALEDAGVLLRALAQSTRPADALRVYEQARLTRANEVMALSADNGRRLVPRSGAEYRPGSHASAASLGLMAYNPFTVELPGEGSPR